MRKSFFLIRSNLRRAKGQTAAEIALIFLAAGMMNLWLMLSLDYKQNFERWHQRLNGEHVTVCVSRAPAAGEAEPDKNSDEMKQYITEVLEQDTRTSEFCMDDVMCSEGKIQYNGGEAVTNFIMMKKDDALKRPVGRVELVEDSQFTEGIYLPMIYKTGDIAVGTMAELTIGKHKVSSRVCGFFNSVMTGSHNCGMCEILMTEQTYQEWKNKGYAPDFALVSVRISDKEESEAFETMLNHAVSARYPEAFTISNSYTLVSQSRYISQMICSSVVSAMAFFVLLIVLAVVSSNIINYIQENMKNLGVWKAIGYQSRQLIGMLMLQFLAIAGFAAVLGAAMSYVLFPGVNDMMVSQTGIPYEIHILPEPLLLTLAVVCSAVALTVWLSARRIRKIPPIDALRQGIQTHSFRRSRIPLDKTRVPLNAALSLKTALSGMKYNLTICVTMLLLSLMLVFSGLMLENVIVDITYFLNLVVGEMADTCININIDAEEEFLREMKKDSRVEKVYLYHTEKVEHVGGVELLVNICGDFSQVNNQEVVIEGRFPEFDNEIAVAAKYAGEQGCKIGDEIRMNLGEQEETYIISGLTQISNNLGKDCLLTRKGYERMGDLSALSYFINLTESTDTEDFNKEVSRRMGSKVIQTRNISEIIYGISAVYVSLLTVIVAAVLLISLLITVFVMYLLVRAMLSSKKREYGILKSLGFTTAQLMVQTALSFMPAVIISSIAGLIINSFLINPLMAVFLREIGIVTCTFRVPVGFIAAAGAGLVVFAFGAACLMSLRIKKIVPRSLLVND